MLALALELTGNTGAHTVSYVPLSNGYRVAPTVYDVPVAWVRLRGVMTNTVPTGAVPRRRPAGGDRRHGAADRHRGAAPEDRPGGAAPPQPDPARQAAAPHRDRAHLRQRRLRRQPRARARDRRLGRLSGASQGGEEARPAARHRRGQLRRDAGRHAARACRREGRRPRAGSIWSSARSRAGRATRPASAR